MKIEILWGMKDCMGLKGLELFLFSLIYSQVEMSFEEIRDATNMDEEELRNILTKLRLDGFIICERYGPDSEITQSHYFEKSNGQKYWLYLANPEVFDDIF